VAKRTKPYSPDLKERVIREVLDKSRPHFAVTEEFEITESSVSRWVAAYRKAHLSGASVAAAINESDRVRELEKELREVKGERDFLKRPRPSSPASIGDREVRVHRRREGYFPDIPHARAARRLYIRVS
jgi:transposase-like protein